MISFIAGLIELAFWLLLLALTIGLLSGFAVLVWKSGRETLVFAHEQVIRWGDRGVAMAMEELRVRYPAIFPESETSAEVEQLRDEINRLQYVVAAEKGRAAGLSDLVDDLKRQVEAGGSGPGHELYARVGLHCSAPDFLVFAARREFRRRLHPDPQPAGRKAEFTKRFQDAEQAFAEIWSQRGLK